MLSIVWFIFNQHRDVLPWDADMYKEADAIIYFASYNPYENKVIVTIIWLETHKSYMRTQR